MMRVFSWSFLVVCLQINQMSATSENDRAIALKAQGHAIPGFQTIHKSLKTPSCLVDPLTDEPGYGLHSECLNRETIEAYEDAMAASRISDSVTLRVKAHTLGEVTEEEFRAALEYVNKAYQHTKVKFELVDVNSIHNATAVAYWEKNPWMEWVTAGVTLPPISKLEAEFHSTLGAFGIPHNFEGASDNATAIHMIVLPAPHGKQGRPGAGVMGFAINSAWQELGSRYGPFTVMSRMVFTDRHDPTCASDWNQSCPMQWILAHEMGHLLGLSHPHRRVLDCTKFEGEYQKCLPSDHKDLKWLTGDFLGDTPLVPIPGMPACLNEGWTPANLTCGDDNFNSSNSMKFNSTGLENMMGYWQPCYAPMGDRALISPQQGARVRCFAERHYRNLIVDKLETPSLVVVTAALNSSGCGITLSWTTPVGAAAGGVKASAYKISRVPAGSRFPISIPGNIYTDNDIQDGEIYKYSVTPSNSAGSGPSSKVTILTPSSGTCNDSPLENAWSSFTCAEIAKAYGSSYCAYAAIDKACCICKNQSRSARVADCTRRKRFTTSSSHKSSLLVIGCLLAGLLSTQF
jgi:hypothetical protein